MIEKGTIKKLLVERQKKDGQAKQDRVSKVSKDGQEAEVKENGDKVTCKGDERNQKIEGADAKENETGEEQNGAGSNPEPVVVFL